MELVLPRPHPKCLDRYERPFGVFKSESLTDHVHSPTRIRIVRAVDCKQESTHDAIRKVMEEYRLSPLFVAVNFGEKTILDFVEKIFKQHPTYKNSGYVLTRSPSLKGWEYSFDNVTEKVKVSEVTPLPKIIHIGFDLIFWDGGYYN